MPRSTRDRRPETRREAASSCAAPITPQAYTGYIHPSRTSLSRGKQLPQDCLCCCLLDASGQKFLHLIGCSRQDLIKALGTVKTRPIQSAVQRAYRYTNAFVGSLQVLQHDFAVQCLLVLWSLLLRCICHPLHHAVDAGTFAEAVVKLSQLAQECERVSLSEQATKACRPSIKIPVSKAWGGEVKTKSFCSQFLHENLVHAD